MIGYHFRHITDFQNHIPKIVRFWQIQLLDLPKREKLSLLNEGIPNDIIKAHVYLKIKKGEVNRWILLFESILSEFSEDKGQDFLHIIDKWKRKIVLYRRMFLSSNRLFN